MLACGKFVATSCEKIDRLNSSRRDLASLDDSKISHFLSFSKLRESVTRGGAGICLPLIVITTLLALGCRIWSESCPTSTTIVFANYGPLRVWGWTGLRCVTR